MQKKGLQDLLGQQLEHKTLGLCRVDEIIDLELGKFRATVLDNDTQKTLIFSNRFFHGVEDYNTVNPNIATKPKPKKIHREVDLSKYRNHPLVKEIEQKERGYRPRELYANMIEQVELEPDEDII